MKKLAALALAGVCLALQAQTQTLDPHQNLTLDIYRELIEINTVHPHRDDTATARAMARRLLDAGFDAKDVEVIEPAPKKGNLVARFRSNGAQKPILLLAHIDVVKAKKEDWSDGHDPFKLTEKDGYYYGRGTLDDKAMWRWRLSSARPRRRARHRPVLKAGLVSRATRRSGVRPAPLFEFRAVLRAPPS